MLSESRVPPVQPNYVRAIQMLILGLRRELPEGPVEAADYVTSVLRALVHSRPKVVQALREMGYSFKAQALLRQVRKEL